MNGELLLDTNIVIALFAGEASVQKRLDEAQGIFVPSIVLGELIYGAYNSKHVLENLARILDFAQSVSVISVDGDTALHYGRMKSSLRRKGRPVLENDIWLAAIAAQHTISIATRDEHFREFEGIGVEFW
jgi:tRNA(fMet)-specific endonuclease VapC